MKLLFDENLSPRLVERAAKLGIYATHVAHIGLAGRSDPDVFRHAFENDMVVATMNVGNFLTLAGDIDLHPGVIALRGGGLTADEQWAHLQPALLDCLKFSNPAAAMVNHVVEIIGIGRFSRYSLPKT